MKNEILRIHEQPLDCLARLEGIITIVIYFLDQNYASKLTESIFDSAINKQAFAKIN